MRKPSFASLNAPNPVLLLHSGGLTCHLCERLEEKQNHEHNGMHHMDIPDNKDRISKLQRT